MSSTTIIIIVAGAGILGIFFSVFLKVNKKKKTGEKQIV